MIQESIYHKMKNAFILYELVHQLMFQLNQQMISRES